MCFGSQSSLRICIQQVAIVLLAVVAAVAADSYGYNKSYKPTTTYAAPAYKPTTYSAPAYKEEYSVSQLKRNCWLKKYL